MPPSPPALVSADFLADRYSLSRRSILRLIAQGKLTPINPLKRCMRFSLEEADKAILGK